MNADHRITQAGASAPRRGERHSTASEQMGEVLDGFAPVALDELNDEAGLLTRVDRKYLIGAADAAAVIGELAGGSKVLDFDGVRSSRYTSVYFDTPDRLSYRLAAHGRRRRFKVRTRCYTDADLAYLEMKTKGGRGATVKERIEYSSTDISRLTEAGGVYVADALRTVGYDPELGAELAPALATRYRRSTLLLPGGSRATIDTDLEWVDSSEIVLSLPGYVILESKSPGRTTAVDHLLWRRGYRPVGISKFGTGTAALHPELPGNKWHRLLRGPFAEATFTGPMLADQASNRVAARAATEATAPQTPPTS